MPGWLVLTRRDDQDTYFELSSGDQIVVRVRNSGDDRIQIAVKAPKNVAVVRGEARNKDSREAMSDLTDSHRKIRDALAGQQRDFVRDPNAGDVVEIREILTDEVDGTEFEHDTLLRVLAVKEGLVWLKLYGQGFHTWSLARWIKRLTEATHCHLKAQA